MFDIIFSKSYPGGGLSVGFALTTIAMAILLVFAIIPVLFIAGPKGKGESKPSRTDPKPAGEKQSNYVWDTDHPDFKKEMGNIDQILKDNGR